MRSLLLFLLVVASSAPARAQNRPPVGHISLDAGCLRTADCTAGTMTVFSVTPFEENVVIILPIWQPLEILPTDQIEWDFGDGTHIRTTGLGQVAHRYAAPGLYTARATMTIAGLGPGTPIFRSEREVRVFPAAPSFVQFSKPHYDAQEADGKATLELTRSGDVTQAVSVRYSVPDSRYRQDGIVTIAAGQTTVPFSIAVPNDDAFATPRRFAVQIQSTDAIVQTRSAGVTLHDDEPAVVVSAEDIRVVEGDSGKRQAVFTVSLSRPLPAPLTVDYFASGGSATVWNDMEPTANQLTFPTGQTTAQIIYMIVGDTEPERDEHFTLLLHSWDGSPYAVARRPVCVIVDDDLSFVDDDVRAPAGTRSTLTLRTGTVPQSRVVTLTSSDPSIIEVPPSVTFAPGESLATFAIEAKAPGTATVHADNASATVHVFHLLVPSFVQSTLRTAAGRTETVTLATTPARATPFFASVTSSDPSVVAVTSPIEIASGSGTVSLATLQPGRATITATLPASLGGMSVTMDVVVEAPPTRRRPR